MQRTRCIRSLVDPIAEPERYARARLLLQRIRRAMAEERDLRPLKDFAQPSNEEPSSSIVNPIIPANNCELKPSLLQILQTKPIRRSRNREPKPTFKSFYPNSRHFQNQRCYA